MKFYRLDCQHELDGALTRFFRADNPDIVAPTAALERAGWLVDLYVAELGRVGREEAELLCATLWPNAPDETILGLVGQMLARRNGEREAAANGANRAVADARARLDELVARKTPHPPT